MSLMDVSSKLGEYMLKGWVLTDNTCPTPGCSVPLMRSPAARQPPESFCANCDGGPKSLKADNLPLSRRAAEKSPASADRSSNSTASIQSRASTPPTELSDLESPEFVLPPETEEVRQRRAQSDLASQEIGNRMLKGWAMLGDECPNPTCYGVPLVRPPNSGGEKDPRKECVVCHRVYVTSPNGSLVEQQPVEADTRRAVVPTTSTNVQRQIAEVPTNPRVTPAKRNGEPLSSLEPPRKESSSSGTTLVLEATINSLEESLKALSERLAILSSATPLNINPALIGEVASSMSAVMISLEKAKSMVDVV